MVEESGAVDAAGQGGSPHLMVDGFEGSLASLLAQARSHMVDLSRLRLSDLINQLADRLDQARAILPLGHQADWVVMASWVLLLRSDLLLPREPPAQQEAEQHTCKLRDRLVALQETQALANWLDQRPQLGRDVFGRGQPEAVGRVTSGRIEIDMIAFLWACLAQLGDPADAIDTSATYRIDALDLHSIPQARDRILRLLADTGGALGLDQLLPVATEDSPAPPPTTLRRRSAWTSTFVAGLELARQGALILDQDEHFGPVRFCPIPLTQ